MRFLDNDNTLYFFRECTVYTRKSELTAVLRKLQRHFSVQNNFLTLTLGVPLKSVTPYWHIMAASLVARLK